ncbi:MAG: GNAT family N-acetyltransferase [Proteobacteria bacterium]|nr:GNAT family N-acetyltransferase [Pseudomonadota bacterium]
MQIRSLNSVDADALYDLRREALLDSPLAFSASPEDDIAGSTEAVRSQLENRSGSLVFGAFEGGLHGMLGINRARHIKAARKAYLWGMYVQPDWRGQGIGAALLATAISHARTLSGVRAVYLSVSEASPSARRLYERAGFRLWATEPDSLQVGEQLLSEYHLMLRLPPA